MYSNKEEEKTPKCEELAVMRAFFSLHQSSWVIKWWFSLFLVEFCFLNQCFLAYHQRCSPVVNAHSITALLIRNIHTSLRHWSSVSGTPSSGNFSHFFPPGSSKAKWFGYQRIICPLPARILFVDVIRLFGFWKIRKCLFFPLTFRLIHIAEGQDEVGWRDLQECGTQKNRSVLPEGISFSWQLSFRAGPVLPAQGKWIGSWPNWKKTHRLLQTDSSPLMTAEISSVNKLQSDPYTFHHKLSAVLLV